MRTFIPGGIRLLGYHAVSLIAGTFTVPALRGLKLRWCGVLPWVTGQSTPVRMRYG